MGSAGGGVMEEFHEPRLDGLSGALYTFITSLSRLLISSFDGARGETGRSASIILLKYDASYS